MEYNCILPCSYARSHARRRSPGPSSRPLYIYIYIYKGYTYYFYNYIRIYTYYVLLQTHRRRTQPQQPTLKYVKGYITLIYGLYKGLYNTLNT